MKIRMVCVKSFLFFLLVFSFHGFTGERISLCYNREYVIRHEDESGDGTVNPMYCTGTSTRPEGDGGPGSGRSGEGTGGEGDGRGSASPDSYADRMDSINQWRLQTRTQVQRAQNAIISEAKEKIIRERQKDIEKSQEHILRASLKWLRRDFFNVTDIDEQWFQRINERSKKIPYELRDQYEQSEWIDGYLLPEEIEAAARHDVAGYISEELVWEIFLFRFKILKNKRLEQLKIFFSDINVQNQPNWVEEADSVIKGVSDEIKKPIYSSPIVFGGNPYGLTQNETKDADVLEPHLIRIQNDLYDVAISLMQRHVLEPHKEAIRDNINSVKDPALTLMEQARAVDTQQFYNSAHFPQDHYEADVTDVAIDILRANHDRRQLSLLNDEAFNKPEEEPYEFQSPEGEFSEKNRSLYAELYEANPFHEQGVYAREIGLAAVQVADEEFAQGNTEEANLAYQIGEGVSDITLGVISYVGTGKDAYEALIGKHLLTGRTLSGFERSMSVVGIALSAMSAGVLSSGHVKLVLNSTESVLSKIRQKLGDPIVRGIQGIQSILKEYPAAFFRKVENMGIRTKEGAKSTLQYLKRVFKGRDPSIEEMENAIESSAKEGAGRASGSTPELPGGGKRAPPPSSTIPSSTEDILKAVESAGGNTQAYRAALREISDLPDSGKEFLANKVFYIFKESGEQLSQAQLVKLGRLYTQYAKAIDIDRLGSVQVNRRVWRFLGKEGVDSSGKTFKNTPEGIFKDHPGMLGSNRRYSSSGDWGMYTSLNRNTALREAKAQHFGKTNVELTNNQVEELYHIGSREIELDQVLDLTNTDTLRKISDELTEKSIKENINEVPNAYESTQMIGHLAKRKGYKGIQVPSAVDNGVNVIIFNKDLL